MTMIKFFWHAIQAGFNFYMILSIPLIIFLTFLNYLKKGYVNKWVLFVTSIFAIYISTMFFIVMWPFPQQRSCIGTSKYYHITYHYFNLMPLSFIHDYYTDLNHTYNLHSFLKASKSLINTFLNVLMFIPLGMYFGYVFKFKARGIVIVGFITSLFIETMQLTGFLGYYNCSWRLFEIDDLITNTLGAITGWWIYRKTLRWYFDIDTIDNYEKENVNGKLASTFRIFFSNMFDFVLYNVVIILITTLFELPHKIIYSYPIYRFLMIWLFNGRHLGLILTRVHVLTKNKKVLLIAEKIKLSLWYIVITWTLFPKEKSNETIRLLIFVSLLVLVIIKKTFHICSLFTNTQTEVKLKQQNKNKKQL